MPKKKGQSLKILTFKTHLNTMKQDKHKTKVIFLMEKPEGDLPCNVFAFFPEGKYSHWENGTFSCYAHLGQHSACHIDYANECKEATPEQYKDLKTELEGIGYNLEIVAKKFHLTY